MKKLSLIVVILSVVFATSLFAEDIKTPNPGYYCARTIEALEFGLTCEKNNDLETFKKLYDADIIMELEDAARFYVVDRRVFKGYVKIQCVCESYPVWTVKEAIRE